MVAGHLLTDFLASLDQLLFAKRQDYNAHLERIGFRFYQIHRYRRKIWENTKSEFRKKVQARYRFNLSTWRKNLEALKKTQEHLYLPLPTRQDSRRDDRIDPSQRHHMEACHAGRSGRAHANGLS